jgi:hypothetical protein
VESLLALTSSRLSGDQQSWYTEPTWPLKVARNLLEKSTDELLILIKKRFYFPLCPSQSFILLSKDADANNRPSGEKRTWAESSEGDIGRGTITTDLVNQLLVASETTQTFLAFLRAPHKYGKI